MTIWPAYGSFEESVKGSIEPGKFADLVVLDKDIMSMPYPEIIRARVVMTILNGRWSLRMNRQIKSNLLSAAPLHQLKPRKYSEYQGTGSQQDIAIRQQEDSGFFIAEHMFVRYIPEQI